KELKLPMLREHLEASVKEAQQFDITYEEFLAHLLQKEWDARQESSFQKRMNQAQFLYQQGLEDLSVPDLPIDAQRQLKQLKTLAFVEEGRNLILAGNSGTGKTALAIGLGTKACMEGYRVWFTNVPKLIHELKECKAERTLRTFQKRFEKYDVVIVDEMGYISFDKEGAELLFTHLSLRAGRKTTIITTNLSFERWGEIFQDPVMTAAMIDRLTHQAYFVDMKGESYRMKQTKKWIHENQVNKTVQMD
ncbi:MAG TPA: IS21-like element helper ATPase IstB, partial [Bacillota bacterium]|nr:IS21-like element helper ATPase IstB [Bacillota bacterium]